MSDARLRDLARLSDQTLAISDEASLLRARCAAGQLETLRLQAAARLEYPPAVMALEGTDPPSLADCLVALGKEAVLRWGASLVRAALPLWDETHTDQRPRAALAVVEQWIRARPGPERDQARSAAQGQIVILAGVAHAAGTAPNQDEAWVFRAAVALLAVVWESNRNLAHAFEEAMLVAAGMPQPHLILERAAQEFVPWLLGGQLAVLEEARPQ